MRRGRFAYIAEPSGLCWRSAEFNGDMYPDKNSPGQKALTLLKKSGKDFKGFEAIVREFYQMYDMDIDGDLPLPLTPMNLVTNPMSDLPAWGYSDYLYMVNGTDEEVKVRDANDKEVTFQPGEVHVFNFGKVMNNEA